MLTILKSTLQEFLDVVNVTPRGLFPADARPGPHPILLMRRHTQCPYPSSVIERRSDAVWKTNAQVAQVSTRLVTEEVVSTWKWLVCHLLLESKSSGQTNTQVDTSFQLTSSACVSFGHLLSWACIDF